MLVLPLVLGAVLCASQANAGAVFAHFMVGNTQSYNPFVWAAEFAGAQGAHIDAFALNMAYGESWNHDQVTDAFSMANKVGFKLFFSFDYAGRGPWDRGAVKSFLDEFVGNGAYYKENGLPLVSTFEGWEQSNDWKILKQSIPMIFVPDWSSLGATDASNVGRGIIDGLFNWAAWANVDNSMPTMDTYVDASYLGEMSLRIPVPLSYMMPVSPWFYTNMPGYDKNWKWGLSESLWYERWQQVLVANPNWVQILSWNDYGESHYIGPLLSGGPMAAFGPDAGKAPFNYAENNPHDGWRSFLSYAIDLYKKGTATVTTEGVTAWWRLQSSASGCSDNGTTTNTATHLQIEHTQDVGMKDGVFFAALLGSAATPEVRIGGTVVASSWTFQPDGGIGIYRGQALSSLLGAVTVTLKRGSSTVTTLNSDAGQAIGGCGPGNSYNFNPVVKTQLAPGTIAPATPAQKVADQGCIAGTGKGAFAELCQYTCALDYCPLTACLCTKLGRKVVKPRGAAGYARDDQNFSGLCAVACSYGFCPTNHCDTVEHQLPSPGPVSPFTPLACRAGTGPASGSALAGPGPLQALCAFGCNYGHCPIKAGCTCTETGALRDRPTATGMVPSRVDDRLPIRLLCRFACKYGYCETDGYCNDTPPPPPPPPAPTHWATIGDTFSGGSCGTGCTSLRPAFSEDRVRSWCQGLVAQCDKNTILAGDGGIGSLAFSVSRDVTCAVGGPASVDECYGIFVDGFSDPQCTLGGPAGASSCISYITNPDGLQLGDMGFIGTCINGGGNPSCT